MVAETPVEVIKVDSLQHEIDRLKGLIAQYKQSETSLNGKLYDYEQTIKVQNKKIERLNSYLLLQTQLLLDYQMIVCERSMTRTE